MRGFSVTFARFFPHDESEEVYEADEIGFVIENVSLRDAMRLGLEWREPSEAGFCEPDSCPAHNVRWLTFHEWNHGTREYFRDGIKEDRALHFPDSITEASRRRICRLFGMKV